VAPSGLPGEAELIAAQRFPVVLDAGRCSFVEAFLLTGVLPIRLRSEAIRGLSDSTGAPLVVDMWREVHEEGKGARCTSDIEGVASTDVQRLWKRLPEGVRGGVLVLWGFSEDDARSMSVADAIAGRAIDTPAHHPAFAWDDVGLRWLVRKGASWKALPKASSAAQNERQRSGIAAVPGILLPTQRDATGFPTGLARLVRPWRALDLAGERRVRELLDSRRLYHLPAEPIGAPVPPRSCRDPERFQSFLSILDRPRKALVGPRGAGKHAILEYLALRDLAMSRTPLIIPLSRFVGVEFRSVRLFEAALERTFGEQVRDEIHKLRRRAEGVVERWRKGAPISLYLEDFGALCPRERSQVARLLLDEAPAGCPMVYSTRGADLVGLPREVPAFLLPVGDGPCHSVGEGQGKCSPHLRSESHSTHDMLLRLRLLQPRIFNAGQESSSARGLVTSRHHSRTTLPCAAWMFDDGCDGPPPDLLAKAIRRHGLTGSRLEQLEQLVSTAVDLALAGGETSEELRSDLTSFIEKLAAIALLDGGRSTALLMPEELEYLPGGLQPAPDAPGEFREKLCQSLLLDGPLEPDGYAAYDTCLRFTSRLLQDFLAARHFAHQYPDVREPRVRLEKQARDRVRSPWQRAFNDPLQREGWFLPLLVGILGRNGIAKPQEILAVLPEEWSLGRMRLQLRCVPFLPRKLQPELLCGAAFRTFSDVARRVEPFTSEFVSDLARGGEAARQLFMQVLRHEWRNGKQEERRALLQTLAALPGPSATRTAVEWFDGCSTSSAAEEMRVLSVHALGGTGTWEARGRLAALVSDPGESSAVREAAVRSLARDCQPSDVTVLAEALQHPIRAVRLSTARGIGAAGIPAMVPFLQSFPDPEKKEQMAVGFALATSLPATRIPGHSLEEHEGARTSLGERPLIATLKRGSSKRLPPLLEGFSRGLCERDEGPVLTFAGAPSHMGKPGSISTSAVCGLQRLASLARGTSFPAGLGPQIRQIARAHPHFLPRGVLELLFGEFAFLLPGGEARAWLRDVSSWAMLRPAADGAGRFWLEYGHPGSPSRPQRLAEARLQFDVCPLSLPARRGMPCTLEGRAVMGALQRLPAAPSGVPGRCLPVYLTHLAESRPDLAGTAELARAAHAAALMELLMGARLSGGPLLEVITDYEGDPGKGAWTGEAAWLAALHAELCQVPDVVDRVYNLDDVQEQARRMSLTELPAREATVQATAEYLKLVADRNSAGFEAPPWSEATARAILLSRSPLSGKLFFSQAPLAWLLRLVRFLSHTFAPTAENPWLVACGLELSGALPIDLQSLTLSLQDAIALSLDSSSRHRSQARAWLAPLVVDDWRLPRIRIHAPGGMDFDIERQPPKGAPSKERNAATTQQQAEIPGDILVRELEGGGPDQLTSSGARAQLGEGR